MTQRANHKKKISLNEVIMSQTQAVGGFGSYITQGSQGNNHTQTSE